MKSSTRLRALESTAKVALGCYLGAVAGACGGRAVSGVDEPGDTPSAQTEDPPSTGQSPTPTATATASATPPPATASATPPPAPTNPAPDPPPPAPPAPTYACVALVTVTGPAAWPPSMPADDIACCEAYVESQTLPTSTPPTAADLDASALNCCRALANGAAWDQSPAHGTCCSHGVLAESDFNNPYCSPWGPPVPPALVLA